jgi:hypothetical protein
MKCGQNINCMLKNHPNFNKISINGTIIFIAINGMLIAFYDTFENIKANLLSYFNKGSSHE